MRNKNSPPIVITAVPRAVLGGMALAQQGKNTLQVPNGLARFRARISAS
jgi:hypothetical protein